ncbi:MAG: LytR C-terminal domain-containing protein [Tetrasphaera sp.]|nr:LytR C-terminal domain-containing protein [Tetrasphaera sp.]
MSDYVYESGLSTKRRRQRRTAITLLLTALLLFSAFWWAWSYIRTGGESSASASPTSTSTLTPGACADPTTITVNVYNATNRSGLARTAADALTAAGFTVGRVANDPENKSLPGNAEVRFGPAGEPYAVAFREDYGQAVSLAPTERNGTSIDVVLGDTFTGWAPFPETPPC